MKDIEKKIELYIDSVVEMYNNRLLGEKYFDKIDNYIKTDNLILDTIIDKFILEFDNVTFISHGGFGLLLLKRIKERKVANADIMVFEGSARKGEKIFLNKENVLVQRGNAFSKMVFVDDSYYSGDTHSAIVNYLDDFGIEIDWTFVVYDGSKKIKHKKRKFLPIL